MLHQPEIEGQIRRIDPHFVEGEDEGALDGLEIIVGI
jgi:hypothetical protein